MEQARCELFYCSWWILKQGIWSLIQEQLAGIFSLTSEKAGSCLKNQEDADFNPLELILIYANMQEISSDLLPENS